MNIIQETPKESIIFEDTRVLIALALRPLTRGHAIVIWKGGEEDINKLGVEDYEYLMDAARVTRESLLQFYGVEKVYLMYLDETKWVHWHLVPRYDEEGFNILKHDPQVLSDFKDMGVLIEVFSETYKKMLSEGFNKKELS